RCAEVEAVENSIDGVLRRHGPARRAEVGGHRPAARLDDCVSYIRSAAALRHEVAGGAGCDGVDLARAVREGTDDKRLAVQYAGVPDAGKSFIDAWIG